MDDRRAHLARLSGRLRGALVSMGYTVPGDSHIVPVVLGDNATALRTARALAERGIWATAIRYPTVPKGQARIRLSLSASLTDSQIDRVIEAFKDLKR